MMNIDIVPVGMQLPLITNVGIPPRPKIYDDIATERYITALIPGVLKWLRETNDIEDEFRDPSDSYLQQLREELTDACDYNCDGYQFASNLERRFHWGVDSSLVELLEDSAALRMVTFNTLIKEWVFSNGILPQYSVGQRVKFMARTVHVGNIVRVDIDHANYTIYCPELGHTKTPQRNVIGSIINYEAVIHSVET